jgi:hypothetical protein
MLPQLIQGVIALSLACAKTNSGVVAGPQWGTEEEQIEVVARDYIDGWYEANAERMQRALHPDLAKRAFFPLPNGRLVLETASAAAMVELTRAGGGKRAARPNQKNQVIVLDVSGNIASAKTVSPEYVDYLHLAKVNGEWKIVNILWKRVDLKPPRP